MKRSGFTMIELVFIIVILGILGAIAVPKMAASRNDAKAVAIKSDVGTIMQAFPAMAMSQNNADTIDFANNSAVSINEGNWKKSGDKMIYSKINDAGSEPATAPVANDSTQNGDACVVIRIKKKTAETDAAPLGIDKNASYMEIITAAGNNLCKRIGNNNGATVTQNIPLTGRGVSFN